jgi:AraC family transcriptional regulator, regulatory protein of adaptative response / DNA-3-methyladenine glycosylase II
VAKTRRLHFAKKLIDETTLPMTQVALASGFGCVRRFNAHIQKVYSRTPTQIRRLARQKFIQPENRYLFRLRFRPPYHWRGILAFLAARAIPGIEVVEQSSYRRSISTNGCDGYLEVSLDEENCGLLARVQFGDPRSLFLIVERIRSMFDLNADWATIAQGLKSDPLLTGRVKASPGLRIPGTWDGFELATRAILGQQVTVKGATTLAGRIARAFGRQFSPAAGLTHLFPPPEVLAEANLHNIGLPKARAETIRSLARAVCEGRLSFHGIASSEAITRLREIPGIGKWTTEYIAMRALGEPDAFPSGDLALLRASGLPTFRELEKRADAWRPWRAYAAMFLWNVASK